MAGGGEIHTSCSTSEASVFHPAPVTPTAPSEKAGAQQWRGQRVSFQAFCLRYGGRNCQGGSYWRSTSGGVHFIKYEKSFLEAAYSCFLIQNPGLAISDLQIWQQKDFMSLARNLVCPSAYKISPAKVQHDFIAM